MWVEWCTRPWYRALKANGFPLRTAPGSDSGRRGALLRASADGRSGIVRTCWSAGADNGEALASSVEAYFDFDTPAGGAPTPPADEGEDASRAQVRDSAHRESADVIARCFRFRYERSWSEYYRRAALAPPVQEALWRHALGTIALDIPLLLAFLLLMAARAGLPQREPELAALNRARRHAGKRPVLGHVEVRAPLLPEFRGPVYQTPGRSSRSVPRLHQVRGHLMRRGGALYWRIPHLRGSARAGGIQKRTVIWTFDARPPS
ncbi:MAG: hypothetical protein JOZ03_11080 [Gammaproteobacteria bacterium]|nr:hypothetical protein [Gammaproteobacteria bacterium]